MKTILMIFLICLSSLCAGGSKTDPEEKFKVKHNGLIKLQKTLNFTKIYEQHYFHDKDLLKGIRTLSKKQDTIGLFNALCTYIGQFGIENFKKDTYLIWELAMISQSMGYNEEAVSLYNLVFKHHHSMIDFSEIRKVKDSLSQIENGSYVSLDYYYQISEHSNKVDKVIAPHSKAVNLGSKINSEGPDYGPAYHAQSQSLLFTSQRSHLGLPTQKVNENLYISTRDSCGNWSRAKEIKEISSPYNEGSGCISPDGNTLYFSRCNSPDSFGNCDLFMSSLQKDGSWGPSKNLGEVINSTKWESHPTLSHTGDTLYFASDRDGGFGKTDIYFTFKNRFGKWIEPRNLGPAINTKEHDLSPFYHPTHNVLYFSSNGQPNTFGLFDIYKVPKANHIWGNVENVGPHVNHEGSEMYFTIDPETNHLFFARSANHQLNKQDIYSFPLPMEAHPASTTTIKGTLTDSISGQDMNGIVSVIDIDSGIEVLPKYTNKSGEYAFDLIDQKDYMLVVRGKDFFRVEKKFRLNGPTSLDIKTHKISNNVTFKSINFDFDSAIVKESMYSDLKKVVKFLFDNPEYQLQIEGHTDEEGSHEYNLDLSARRAKNIRQYIISAGIDPLRVNSEGFGEKEPLMEGESSRNRATNRRVEFHLYNPEKPEQLYESITVL